MNWELSIVSLTILLLGVILTVILFYHDIKEQKKFYKRAMSMTGRFTKKITFVTLIIPLPSYLFVLVYIRRIKINQGS